MKQGNKKNIFIIIVLISIVFGGIMYLANSKNTNTNANVQQQNEMPTETQYDNLTIQYDEMAIKEIKDNIENLEIKYIENNDKSREYAEGTFKEINKINKENYKKYFQSEEEYGKYVSEIFMKMCEYVNNLVQDFSKAKVDTKTFSNRIFPLLEQGNNFIDYMQENPDIYFKDSYTNVRKAKYDSLQKEISNAYIFFDMDFAKDVTDVINAYNSQKLPKNKEKYREKAQRIANGILKLRDNKSSVTLSDFINKKYKGDMKSITNSILSDIDTFSSFSDTYNSSSGTAVSNLVTNYGELLTLVGDDIIY